MEGKDLLILGIDTSGKTASVAVCDKNTVIAQTTFLTKLTHSQVILPLVEKLLSDAGIALSDVEGFAVANGPGSYTGLRIGISAIKAMCFALDKKCVGISTLESLAYNCIATKGIIIPLMKARNDIAYFAVFKSDGKKLECLHEDSIAEIEEIKSVVDFSSKNINLVGDYADECFEKYFKEYSNVSVAPAHEKNQLASSLCMLAQGKELHSPDELNASYLQITKAEKDKISN